MPAGIAHNRDRRDRPAVTDMSAQDNPPRELLVLVRRDHDDGDIGMVTAQGIKHRGTWR